MRSCILCISVCEGVVQVVNWINCCVIVSHFKSLKVIKVFHDKEVFY